MPRDRLPPFCEEETLPSGAVRVRVRVQVDGKRIKRTMPGVPWSGEFMAAYNEAVAAIKPPTAPTREALPKTWRWLCQRYFRSAAFLALDERTRYVRRPILEKTFAEPLRPGADETFGDMPLPKFGAKAIKILRDRKRETPHAADGRLKAIKQVMSFAVEDEIIEINPARDIGYLKVKSTGFHTWSIAEVRQYEKRHPIGTQARLALALLIYIGGRRADIPALGRQHISAGWLRYTQHKNRKRAPVTLQLPVLPALQAIIDATPDVEGRLTFLQTQFGASFTANGFGNWFKKRCREAALPHCSAHGLRKAGATIAAENGATEYQLMSIFGWTNPKQAAHYVKMARQKKLAGEAMSLIDWEDEPGTQDGPTPSIAMAPRSKSR